MAGSSQKKPDLNLDTDLNFGPVPGPGTGMEKSPFIGWKTGMESMEIYGTFNIHGEALDSRWFNSTLIIFFGEK